MSEFFSVTLELLCHVYTSLANQIISHFGPRYAEDDIQETFQERDDFVSHDQKDTIIEEYENPRKFIDPSAWRRNMPTWKVSLKNSTYFVFMVTFVVGGLIGLASLLLTWYIISIVYACDWKSLADSTYPLHLKRRRIIGQSYQSFILYFWQPALMCMVFKWQFLKDVNLLTCTLAGASLDLGYRFFLGLFDMYYPPWVPYPLNVVYIVVVIMTTLSISKKIIQNSSRIQATIVLAFKLGSQFITGAIVLYIIWYAFISSFVQKEGFMKLLYLVLLFPIALFPKVISRQCVLRLDHVNHPGTSYVLVSTACGSAIIVYRLLQAEFKNLLAFTALSIGYGVSHLAYELIILLREHKKEKRWKTLYLESESNSPGHSATCHTSPRAKRLDADLTIQEMIFSCISLVLSVGIIFVYGFTHCSVSIEQFQQMTLKELVAKILLGLFIEFVFNTLTVILLTRGRNIPVLRVWNCKWKSHLIVCVITVTMIVTYSMDKLLVLVRAQYVVKNSGKELLVCPSRYCE